MRRICSNGHGIRHPRFSILLTHLFVGCFIVLGPWITKVNAAPFAYIDLFNGPVYIFDTATNDIIGTFATQGYSRGIAVNAAGTRVYIVSGFPTYGVLSVIDASTNSVVAVIPVGLGAFGVAVNPAGTRVYVTNQGESTVSVVDTATNTVIATVSVGNQPIGVAVNPAGTLAYVANYGVSSVAVIDIPTSRVLTYIGVENGPVGITFNPAGTRAYTANQGHGTVSVIDTSSPDVSLHHEIAAVSVGSGPTGIAVNPTGTRVYVTNQSSDTVSVIDASINSVIATIAVGQGPVGVAVTPSGGKVYVVDDNAHNGGVSIIDAATNAVVDFKFLGEFPQGFGQFIASSLPITADQLGVMLLGQEFCVTQEYLNFDKQNTTFGHLHAGIDFGSMREDCTKASKVTKAIRGQSIINLVKGHVKKTDVDDKGKVKGFGGVYVYVPDSTDPTNQNLGTTVIYLHLAEIFVNPNQDLVGGEIIGTVGSTGAKEGNGPHLHVEIRHGLRPSATGCSKDGQCSSFNGSFEVGDITIDPLLFFSR